MKFSGVGGRESSSNLNRAFFARALGSSDGAQKMDDLLELADSALYQAKNQGKNQICVTNPIP